MKKCIIFLMITSIFCSLNGCVPKKDTTIDKSMICTVKDKPISSAWLFDLNQNNQILNIYLKTDITYENIKKVYPDRTEDEIIDIYIQEKNKMMDDYNFITSKYPQSKPWYNASFSYDDANMSLTSDYHFHVTHERFRYDLEDEFLNNFGIKLLYDTTKKAFFYDESNIKSNLFPNSDMNCQNIVKTDKWTY